MIVTKTHPNYFAIMKINSRWVHLVNYSTLFSLVIIFVFLQKLHGANIVENSLAFYAKSVFEPLKDWLLWFLSAAGLYFSVIVFAAVLSFIIGGAIRQHNPVEKLKSGIRGEKLRFFIVGIKNFFIFAGPPILSLFTLSLVLGQIDALNTFRLQDNLILSWDKWLTGKYFFISMANINFPWWFLQATIFSFGILPAVATIFSFIAAEYKPGVLKKFTAAFSLALLMMLTIWILLPALSPQDRFMDNVYKLPISAEIGNELKSYDPPKEIKEFLTSVRERKNDLGGVMPTPTFPSAHVAWATLLLIYAFRAKKLWGWMLLPLAALSTLGTTLLAQHYFVDIPAGIAVAVAATVLVDIGTRRKNAPNNQ